MTDEGITARSPKEALKETFRYGLIKDENLFLDMLEDKNLTTHIYSEDISKEVFNRIKDRYSKALKIVIKELSRKID